MNMPDEGRGWKKENNGEEILLCNRCTKLYSRHHGYTLFHEHPTPVKAWFCLKCILIIGHMPDREMTMALELIGYPEEQ